MDSFKNLYSAFYRRADAEAFINGNEEYPDIRGRVLFYQSRFGVIVSSEITGLPKGSGVCDSPVFAFHIHSGSRCRGNPYHAGNFPPLFGADGKALSVFLTDRFTVSEIIGKTVIIHSSPDDFTTQPSGNAGKKIACGVITATAE